MTVQNDSKSFTHFCYDAQGPNSISDNNIVALLQDRHGSVWAGTYYGGLSRFDQASGRWTRYLHDPHNAGSLAAVGMQRQGLAGRVADVRRSTSPHTGMI